MLIFILKIAILSNYITLVLKTNIPRLSSTKKYSNYLKAPRDLCWPIETI